MSMIRCRGVLGIFSLPFSFRALGLACLLIFLHSRTAYAAFGGYLPLNMSGSLSYSYGYVSTEGTESETTTLTASLSPTGYIWKPWFATTSAALNLGLSNTETTSSSADATVLSGAFSMSVFPLSRFPFSLTYTQTDSRSESYSDVTQVSGGSEYKSTRLSLRQSYRGRHGTLTNAWFYKSRFDAAGLNSDSKNYGMMLQENRPANSLSISLSHSVSTDSNSDAEPKTDSVSLSHSYTPSGELGVSNILSLVKSESGSGALLRNTTYSQGSSSFFWRPEHRAFSISGGVRLSENAADVAGDTSRQRSLNTNVNATYRLTRSLYSGASVSVGSSEGGGVQTVTTSEAANIGFTSNRYLISGFDYSWQSSVQASNSTTSLDDGVDQTTKDVQSYGVGLGHSASTNWRLGQASSLGFSVSQSLSGSKSSTDEVASKSLNQGVSMTWSRRGKRGSTYAGANFNDSRTRSSLNSRFQQFGLNMSQDWTVNQLSSVNGSVSYQASRSVQENLNAPGDQSTLYRTVNGNMAYSHSRPFGIYNLVFFSRLTGSKEINSPTPTSQLDWDNRFDYSLGKLDTSLNFRIIQSGAGSRTSSLFFRATRNF